MGHYITSQQVYNIMVLGIKELPDDTGQELC
jgi:hypothetical protein